MRDVAKIIAIMLVGVSLISIISSQPASQTFMATASVFLLVHVFWFWTRVRGASRLV